MIVWRQDEHGLGEDETERDTKGPETTEKKGKAGTQASTTRRKLAFVIGCESRNYVSTVAYEQTGKQLQHTDTEEESGPATLQAPAQRIGHKVVDDVWLHRQQSQLGVDQGHAW